MIDFVSEYVLLKLTCIITIFLFWALMYVSFYKLNSKIVGYPVSKITS